MIRKYDLASILTQVPDLYLDIFNDSRELAQELYEAAGLLKREYSQMPVPAEKIRKDVMELKKLKAWSQKAHNMFLAAMIWHGYKVGIKGMYYTFEPHSLALDLEPIKRTKEPKEKRKVVHDIPEKFQKKKVCDDIFRVKNDIKHILLNKGDYIFFNQIIEVAQSLGIEIHAEDERRAGNYIISLMKRDALLVTQRGSEYLFQE